LPRVWISEICLQLYRGVRVMTFNTIVATKKFTLDLTKAELDSIQKQFLKEMEKELSVIRKNIINKKIWAEYVNSTKLH
jgi:hypothetical protein